MTVVVEFLYLYIGFTGLVLQHHPFNVEPGLKFVERREKSSFSLRLNQLDEGAGGGGSYTKKSKIQLIPYK